jgi:hypothetical protein
VSLLDRFKPQPRWKHADPAVRVSAIQALDDADDSTAEVLASLAAQDPDVRVRRTAVARLLDPSVLGRAARDDADEAVRQKAVERLLALAQNGVTPNGTGGFSRAEAALAALDEPRHLAVVAKGEADDRLRRRALERLTDAKALGSVARHAKDAAIAALAVEHINDPNELLNVAMKTDHKQAGVMAVERLAVASPADRNAFEQIADRAAEKAVARRARAAVQAIDHADAAQRAAEEAERERQREREREEARLAREREQQAREAAREAALAPRRALCERMESAVAEAQADDVQRARAEWEGLPTSDEGTEDVDALRARFDKACGDIGRAIEARAAADAARARLEELAASAETTAALESLGEARIGLGAIEPEWRALEPHLDALGEAGAATRARYAAARERVAAREAERHAAETKALADNLRRLERLADRIEKRAPAQDLTLREAERAMKELRPAIDEPGPLPTTQDRDTIIERLKKAQAALAPRARELREMDDWKRFANAAVQEDLCARTEALLKRLGEPDPPGLDAVAKELREINAKWREAAEAPRAQAQALWHRYRRAFDPIQLLCREHFAAQAQERAANLTAKLALCERAEAVAESTDWIKTADELRALQAEWQKIGPVPHEQSKAIWQRFRSACNRFFTRRHDDLAKRKEMWSANQAKKVALCERAEALAESTEWDSAAAELRRLQNEWKTIGSVKKTKAEALWNRFRAACDRFFERYKQRDAIALDARVKNREAAVVAFEELAATATPDRDATELRDAVREVRRRWDSAGPIPTDRMAPLDARYNEALERILSARPDVFRGTDLDPDANLQKLEKLCVRVEKLAVDEPSQPTSSEALAAMLREALAANTIGGRPSEESRIKAAIEEVRQAQAAWKRVGPAPRDAVNELARRFHHACDRVFEQQRKRVPVGPPAR